MGASREGKRGHKCRSWVVYRRCLPELERRLSRKLPLILPRWAAGIDQDRTLGMDYCVLIKFDP